MTSLGWADNSGLGGTELSGNPNHIVATRLSGNEGIGSSRARKEGEDQVAGAGQAGRGLEDVLKRLAGAAGDSAPAAEVSVVEITPASRNKVA